MIGKESLAVLVLSLWLFSFRLPGTDIAPLYNVNSSVWTGKGVKCTFIFVKIKKCASSTIGGIARQMAYNRMNNFNFNGVFDNFPSSGSQRCKFYGGHYPQPHLIEEIKSRKFSDVFLIGSIRKPADRALSQYYHIDVSRKGALTNDLAVLKGLKTIYTDNYMTSWLGSTFKTCQKQSSLYNSRICIDQISTNYDFIVIVERLEESLVALMMLNNLTFRDILYIKPSKSSGSYDDLGYYIVPKKNSTAVHSFLNTRFDPARFDDLLLYEHLNIKLTNTIREIGVDRFKKKLSIFQGLQQKLYNFCKNRIWFPYSSKGVAQKLLSREDCYFNDNGCGRQCIAKFVSTNKLI